MQDEIYRMQRDHIVDFAFTAEVASVFPDMIRRSVPGYELIVPMSGLMAAQHVTDDAIVFDLGCSLGACSLALLKYCQSDSLKIIAVDNAPAMIDRAQQSIRDPRISFLKDDIENVAVTGANVVMLNFVVQFLEPAKRDALIKRLAQEMAPGGMLILSEKVSEQPAPDTGASYAELHHMWKQANGYSALEVAQKRQALENVMRVQTEADHNQRLHQAGFCGVRQWFRCLNWASFIAYTPEISGTGQ